MACHILASGHPALSDPRPIPPSQRPAARVSRLLPWAQLLRPSVGFHQEGPQSPWAHFKANQSQLSSTCSLPCTWARDLRYRLGAQDADARGGQDSACHGQRFWVTPIHALQPGRRSGDHLAQPLCRGHLRGSRMGGGGSCRGRAFWPQDPWVLSMSSAGGGAATELQLVPPRGECVQLTVLTWRGPGSGRWHTVSAVLGTVTGWVYTL